MIVMQGLLLHEFVQRYIKKRSFARIDVFFFTFIGVAEKKFGLWIMKSDVLFQEFSRVWAILSAFMLRADASNISL